MDNLEDRVNRLEQARRDLEDALVVHAHLEKSSAERIKEHAQFISRHEQAMQEFDERLKEHSQFVNQHEQTMQEFDGKLNALIDIVMRREGGAEGRS